MWKQVFRGLQSARQEPSTQGLGGVLGRFLPAWTGRRAVGALEHLGSLPLTAQSSLALVRLHDETLLLGITPQNIRVLAKRPNDALPDPAKEERTAR